MEATRGLLTALLEEAPSRVVDEKVAACRTALQHLPPGPRDTASIELAQLLELRGAIERYRKRSRELQALFETAGDLSSMRDEEGVLQAIVRRGRQLLDADAAYLMLVDEDRHDTYMRVTEGTTSPDFPKIRLHLGEGLGGRVAETMTAHWTRDYVRDTRYLHAIDDIVLEENLVAILGVPLKIGRRLLGVLFASHRSPRDFSRDEVSLLSSLGDHAAIAIENASLFQEARDAVAALEAANETIEFSNRRLQLAVELHERLTSLALNGGSVQDLTEVLADVLGGAVAVVDDGLREIASSGESGGRMLERDVHEVIHQHVSREQATGRSSVTERASSAVAVTPVATGQDALGHLIYTSREINDVDVRSLERAATTVALLLLHQRARDDADNRVRGELLVELLSSRVEDIESLVRRARLLGVDLEEAEISVAVVRPADDRGVTTSLQQEASRLARADRTLVAALGDRVVLLGAGRPDSGALATSLADRLTKAGFQVTVGGSGPFSELHHVAHHEDRARRVANVLSGLGRVGQGASAEELGIYGLLLSEVGERHVHDFIDRTVGVVEGYDAARGTSLVETLQAYFTSEANVAEAAGRLYVHTNTMYQRLERLDRLLGKDWREESRALDLRLALKFRELLTSQHGQSPITNP